ncbi:hypothetical protein pipiens_007369 [Culex pipiens pipiens]|uniref:Uncharacterized protein n=1 Tax=Culex pipiens pipiens TaxID=38569 RepID=A0ABD1DL84_CULPP
MAKPGHSRWQPASSVAERPLQPSTQRFWTPSRGQSSGVNPQAARPSTYELGGVRQHTPRSNPRPPTDRTGTASWRPRYTAKFPRASAPSSQPTLSSQHRSCTPVRPRTPEVMPNARR